MDDSLNPLIDAMYSKREEYRRAHQRAEELKAEFKSMEAEVIAQLVDANLLKAGTEVANVSLSSSISPGCDPNCWDDLYRWAISNGYTALLYKGIAKAPYRELRETGIQLPEFITEHEDYKLSLTKRA